MYISCSRCTYIWIFEFKCGFAPAGACSQLNSVLCASKHPPIASYTYITCIGVASYWLAAESCKYMYIYRTSLLSAAGAILLCKLFHEKWNFFQKNRKKVAINTMTSMIVAHCSLVLWFLYFLLHRSLLYPLLFLLQSRYRFFIHLWLDRLCGAFGSPTMHILVFLRKVIITPICWRWKNIFATIVFPKRKYFARVSKKWLFIILVTSGKQWNKFTKYFGNFREKNLQFLWVIKLWHTFKANAREF